MFLILGKLLLGLFLVLFIFIVFIVLLAWFLEMKNPSEISNKNLLKEIIII